VWLRAPLAWDPYDGITIEGALQSVVVTRESSRLPDDAFDGAPSDFFADVPIPIADQEVYGIKIALVSWAIPATNIETVRRLRRRSRVDLFRPAGGRGLLVVSGGSFKNTDVPVSTMTTPFVDFFAHGDAEKIADLARDLGSLGRARGGGLGAIHGVEVDTGCPMRHPLSHHRRPQRTIPVLDGTNAADRFEVGSYEVRERQLRAPYWHLGGPRALCAVPTPVAFTEDACAA
jgi:hypothetical protein